MLGERFVYALISATGIFFVGACFSMYHGIYHLIHPSDLEDLWIGLAVLGSFRSFAGNFVNEIVMFSFKVYLRLLRLYLSVVESPQFAQVDSD